MQTTISKFEKLWMFGGAAVGGSLVAGAFTSAIILGASSGTLTLNAGWMPYVRPALFVLGSIVFEMVMGAWSVAWAIAVWRSPAGKRIFCTLSAGLLGGMLSVVFLGFGGGQLVGTLAGLVMGNLVGRDMERRAERALQSLTEGLD